MSTVTPIRERGEKAPSPITFGLDSLGACMANNSSIEWTEATWNPVAGCTIISPGCTNCYAMRMARRLEASCERCAGTSARNKTPAGGRRRGRDMSMENGGVKFSPGGSPKTMLDNESLRSGNVQAGLQAGVNQPFNPNLHPKRVANGNRQSTRPINRGEPQASSLHFFAKLFCILLCSLTNEAKPTTQAFVGFYLTANAFIKT